MDVIPDLGGRVHDLVIVFGLAAEFFATEFETIVFFRVKELGMAISASIF